MIHARHDRGFQLDAKSPRRASWSRTSMVFRIEYRFARGRTAAIVARRLESGDFVVGPDSSLGGVAVLPVVTAPRRVLPDGNPDIDLFAFYLRDASDIERLPIGAVVELVEGERHHEVPR